VVPAYRPPAHPVTGSSWSRRAIRWPWGTVWPCQRPSPSGQDETLGGIGSPVKSELGQVRLRSSARRGRPSPVAEDGAGGRDSRPGARPNLARKKTFRQPQPTPPRAPAGRRRDLPGRPRRRKIPSKLAQIYPAQACDSGEGSDRSDPGHVDRPPEPAMLATRAVIVATRSSPSASNPAPATLRRDHSQQRFRLPRRDPRRAGAIIQERS
jgi:hypothetical protein